MSDVKYTPGPWIADYSGPNGESTNMGCGYGKSQIIAANGKALAGVNAVEPEHGPMYDKSGLSREAFEQLNANARLIAAAPDLLAALQDVLTNTFDYSRESLSYYCVMCGHGGIADPSSCTNPECPVTQAVAAIARATGGTP